MPEQEVLKLESVTRALGVQLLLARSYGLMGALRVSTLAQSPASLDALYLQLPFARMHRFASACSQL